MAVGRGVESEGAGWPQSDEELTEFQLALNREARAAVEADPWTMAPSAVVGGCFIAYARGEAGPGQAGDRATAVAVAWSTAASTFLGHVVVTDRVPAPYVPGLLARREGPILCAAVSALEPAPDVMLVDATGLDHPRGAGLAVHLGVAAGVPTVGVTHRTLLAEGPEPDARPRGATSPVEVDGIVVGYWVRTRSGTRPVVAHAGWRTSPETAVDTVLAASTEAARTPIPLQEARRVARQLRARAELHHE